MHFCIFFYLIQIEYNLLRDEQDFFELSKPKIFAYFFAFLYFVKYWQIRLNRRLHHLSISDQCLFSSPLLYLIHIVVPSFIRFVNLDLNYQAPSNLVLVIIALYLEILVKMVK